VGGPGPAGDLRTLFDEEYDAMVRLAYVLVGDAHDAEEIVQEAFVEVQQRWSGLLNPGGYLRTAVINGARRRGRRERRRREIVRRNHLQLAGETAAADIYDHTLQVLDALPESQRAALVLAYYGGLGSAEIAEAMGCRPGTARSHVHRGLKRLRRELDR
jgi:RNA polymerase sigma factor (sigma-70 family)